jgi:hypothetical protein
MDFNDRVSDSEMIESRYHYVFIHNVYADFFKSTLDYFSTYLYDRFVYRVVGTYDKAVEYLQKKSQYNRETDKPNLPALVLNPLGELNIADGSSGGKQLWRFPNLLPGMVKRLFVPIYQDANVVLYPGFMRITGEFELLMLLNSFYEYSDLRMYMLQIFGGNDRWIHPTFFNSFIIIPDEIRQYTYKNKYTGLQYKLDWESAGAHNELVKSIAQNKMVFPCIIKPIYKLTTMGDNSARYGGAAELADWRLTASIQYEVEIPSFLILETDYLAEHVSLEVQYGGCYSKYNFTVPSNRIVYDINTDWGLDETSNSQILIADDTTTVIHYDGDYVLNSRYIHILDSTAVLQTTNIVIPLPVVIDQYKKLIINSKDGPLDYGTYWKLSDDGSSLILIRDNIIIESGQIIEIYIYEK